MRTVANLINERGNQLFETQLRNRGVEDVLTLDRYCFSAKKVWISFFHSLFSLFLTVFWITGTDSFAAQLLASISIAGIDSLFFDSFAAQSPQVCFSVFSFLQPDFNFCEKKKTILFVYDLMMIGLSLFITMMNSRMSLPWFCLCMIWCLLSWFFCQYHYQVHSVVILQITMHIVLCWICWCQLHSAVSTHCKNPSYAEEKEILNPSLKSIEKKRLLRINYHILTCNLLYWLRNAIGGLTLDIWILALLVLISKMSVYVLCLASVNDILALLADLIMK